MAFKLYGYQQELVDRVLFDFRGWADTAAMNLLTDGRSTKAAELKHQPAVELCWLLPKARCQFRLAAPPVLHEPGVPLKRRQLEAKVVS